MFVRITVEARRDSHHSRGKPIATSYTEREYPDDLMGEMSASEDGAKAVNSAIDRLAEQEAKLRD